MIQRKDDNAETLVTRLNAFHESTAPLIAYYNEKRVLHNVDATRTMDDVYKQILSAIN